MKSDKINKVGSILGIPVHTHHASMHTHTYTCIYDS